MERFRIIVATHSRLLRDMLKRVIEKKSDLELIGVVDQLSIALEMASDQDADWVIVSLSPDQQFSHLVEELLVQKPATAVMAISDDGQEVIVKWHGLREAAYHNWSLNEMMDLLHGHPSDVVVDEA